VDIYGIVTTGTVDLAIRDLGVSDVGPDEQCGVGVNSEGKDVAYSASINGDPALCVDYYDWVVEYFTNVYPYYTVTITDQLTNCGSVPVKISGVNAVIVDGQNLLPWMVFTWTFIDEDGNQIGPFTGTWDDLVTFLLGRQIGGSESVTIIKNICFVEYDAAGIIMPQNAFMEFQITVTAIQWNEY